VDLLYLGLATIFFLLSLWLITGLDHL